MYMIVETHEPAFVYTLLVYNCMVIVIVGGSTFKKGVADCCSSHSGHKPEEQYVTLHLYLMYAVILLMC